MFSFFVSLKKRRVRVKNLNHIIIIMRFCKSCTKFNKRCIVSSDANKYVKYIRRNIFCDLTSLNTLR